MAVEENDAVEHAFIPNHHAIEGMLILCQ
jgi:hypothetical protein